MTSVFSLGTGASLFAAWSWLAAAAIGLSPAYGQQQKCGVHGHVFALDQQKALIGPLPEATIEFRNLAGRLAAKVTADANAYYRADLAPGDYVYRVSAAGFREENVGRGIKLVLTDGYAVFNFSLAKDPNPAEPPKSPGPQDIGRLQGTVQEKTPDGKRVGLPGATVALRPATGGRKLARALAGPGDAQANGPGHYQMLLAAGTWKAAVSAPGFETFVDPETVEVPPFKTVQRDFVLQRAASPPAAGQGLKVKVSALCAPDPGKPSPTFTITIAPLDAGAGNPEVFNTAGPAFERNLRPGMYEVLAQWSGCAARSGPIAVYPGRYTWVNLNVVPVAPSGTPDSRK